MTCKYQRWVDGSNERLYYPEEKLDPRLWKGIPLQKSFEKVDVDEEMFPFFGSIHLGR